MPVLFQINATANRGAIGKITEIIGEEAISRGWESYIAYGRDACDSASRLIRIGSRLNPYLHYASQRVLDNEGLCSGRATARLIERIKAIRPDIIQLHDLHDHYLNYRLLFEFLNSTDIPVVWTMHDFWAVTGHCMYFVSRNCDRFKTGCHDCPMRGEYPKTFFNRSAQNYRLKKQLFGANGNLHVVAVSRWVADQLRESFLGDRPIHVIANGVDTEAFRPCDDPQISSMFPGKFVILAAASQWNERKGTKHYLRMSEMLADDEIIVLVGLNPRFAKGLPHNIIAVPHTTDTGKLAALYSRADVVTVMSAAETFGMTIVEAYACGTPVVVFDNSAPPSLVTADPPSGSVAENQNVESVCAAVKKIKQAGSGSFGRHCRELALRKYDKTICSGRYLSLYESLL